VNSVAGIILRRLGWGSDNNTSGLTLINRKLEFRINSDASGSPGGTGTINVASSGAHNSVANKWEPELRSTFYAAAALLLVVPLPIAAHAAPPSTQCVSTAVAGGTSDAITIPQLPCIPTTTLLILTISLTNTTTTPTISEAGGATQTILRYNGQAIQPGDLTAGAHVELANNGLNWFFLTVSLGVAVDVREFGAKCGSSDSTAALQSAVNAQAGIGAVMIPCPISIGDMVTLPGQHAAEWLRTGLLPRHVRYARPLGVAAGLGVSHKLHEYYCCNVSAGCWNWHRNKWH
jgi:hypothetical protein